MSMLLAEFQKQLSTVIKKKVAACVVRECDETSPGKYVAFVDEADATYDVSVEIGDEKLNAAACECGGNLSKICRHIAALVLQLDKGKKAPQKEQKKRAKQIPAVALAQQLADDELRAWVVELLLENKHLQLAFVHRFSKPEIAYTPQAVQDATNEALKAALGRKKNADPSEMKKLADLLKKVYEPYFEKYRQAPYEKEAFDLLHAMVVALEDLLTKLGGSTARLSKFLEQMLKNAQAEIQLITTEASWQQAVLYFAQNLPRETTLRRHYLRLFELLMESSTADRQVVLAHMLANHFQSVSERNYYNLDIYNKLLFAFLQRLALLEQYIHLFFPLRYQLEYNVTLIAALIEARMLRKAEEYCRQLLLENVHPEYDIPFLQFLKQIYTLENRESELAEIVSKMLPFTWSFEDYQWLETRLTPEQWHATRSIILSMASRASSSYHRPATEFQFKVLIHHRKFAKLLEKIDDVPWELIAEYFPVLVAYDASRLLKIIFEKQDRSWWLAEERVQEDTAAFEKLYALMIQSYGRKRLLDMLRGMEKFRPYQVNSPFVGFLRKQLSTDN